MFTSYVLCLKSQSLGSFGTFFAPLAIQFLRDGGGIRQKSNIGVRSHPFSDDCPTLAGFVASPAARRRMFHASCIKVFPRGDGLGDAIVVFAGDFDDLFGSGRGVHGLILNGFNQRAGSVAICMRHRAHWATSTLLPAKLLAVYIAERRNVGLRPPAGLCLI